MPGTVIPYIIPYFPLLSCVILLLSFRNSIAEKIVQENGERTADRLLIFSLVGFSYSGLLALLIISMMTRINLDLSVYYLLVSFLSYYVGFNVYSHKSRHWHDHLCNALIDTGSLSLILSALSVILSSHFSHAYKTWMAVSAFMVWYLDHLVRIGIAARHLSSRSYAGARITVAHKAAAGGGRRKKRSIVSDTLWYVLKGYKSE